jgi:hypothetical protein
MTDDKVDFKFSQDTRKRIKEIKEVMEEWAKVLDELYHHRDDVVLTGLPDNKTLREVSREVYVEMTSVPVETFYIKKICASLDISFEEYLQYRNLIVAMESQSKPRKKA